MKSVLVTGGTGSFGRAFVRRMLAQQDGPERICVVSRDEYKQSLMRTEFHEDYRLRFFLGDVRDLPRLRLAFRGVDTVIHAAALKQVPATEYNPTEAVRTNILGAENVIMAALETPGVGRVLGLSSDKACSPVTLYGATKLVAERLFVAANAFRGGNLPMFACTRYGNVTGSRGSVLQVWAEALKEGRPITITHGEMTRFHMTQDQAVELVLLALREMAGGEVFIPKLPAYRLEDLAMAIAPSAWRKHVGIRAGEKMHESLISADEADRAWDHGTHYVLAADGRADKLVPKGFEYRSDKARLMTAEELRGLTALIS